MIFPLPKATAEIFEGICRKFVTEGKARRLPDELVKCVHNGYTDGSTKYSKVYLITVLRKSALDPNKVKVRFFYHDRTIKIPASENHKAFEKQEEWCEVKINDDGIRILALSWTVSGYLQMLSMKFMDAHGNIDVDSLKAVLETAIKQSEGIDKPEIKVILDKR
jgi:hypothetical protein